MLTPGFGAYPKTISNHPTLLNSLISYWELEETSGVRVDSITATGNDLTDNNTVTQNDGEIRKCGQFTAANTEYLSHASNAGLTAGNNNLTQSAWVYLDDITSNRCITNKYLGGTGHEWELFYRPLSNAFAIFHGPADTFLLETTVGAASTSTWYFVCWYHDADNDEVGISVNNNAFDTVAVVGGLRSTAGAFSIGSVQGLGDNMDGRIDEVGYWKRVLTSSEITYLYNNGNGRSFK